MLISCLSGREGLLPRRDRAGGRAAEARGPGQKEDLLLLLLLIAPSQPPRGITSIMIHPCAI